MRKIAIVANCWSPSGGVEQVGFDILDALLDSQFKVRLIGFKQIADQSFSVAGLDSPKILEPRNRRIRSFLMRFQINRFYQVACAKELKTCETIIFTHLNSFLRLSAVAKKKRCILWLHGLEVWGERAKVLEKYVGSNLLVVCVSEYTARHVERYFPRSRIRVIPNAVDTRKFRPADNPHNIRKGEVLIVSRLAVGRPKGHDLLFRALPKVQKSLDGPSSLTVVGDGPDRKRLEQYAETCGIRESVNFLGRVSDEHLVERFQNCAVFCMPAPTGQDRKGNWFGEGFGIVYIQASSCGRPVIASDQGGAPETIQDGKTGFTVDPESVDSLETLLCRVLGDDKLATNMGIHGRKLVEKRFSHKVFVKNLTGIVENDL